MHNSVLSFHTLFVTENTSCTYAFAIQLCYFAFFPLWKMLIDMHKSFCCLDYKTVSLNEMFIWQKKQATVMRNRTVFPAHHPLLCLIWSPSQWRDLWKGSHQPGCKLLEDKVQCLSAPRPGPQQMPTAAFYLGKEPGAS